MDWTSISATPARIALAQAAVRLIPTYGVTTKAFVLASKAVGGKAPDWQAHFPGGRTEALWFISEISDASMKKAFVRIPAPDLAEVIKVRFDQNSDLKVFVRRVMCYDMFHPVQAIRRMQRTASVMFDCLPSRAKPATTKLIALNFFYTFLVMLWIVDKAHTNRLLELLVEVVAKRA